MSRVRVAALGVALALGCASRPSTVARQGEPCDSASTQLELTACRSRVAQRAEALEAERYAAAVQALQTKGVTDQLAPLEASERQWAAYRDAACQAAAGLYGGGSAAGMITADCRARLADQRSAELQVVYLDWATR